MATTKPTKTPDNQNDQGLGDTDSLSAIGPEEQAAAQEQAQRERAAGQSFDMDRARKLKDDTDVLRGKKKSSSGTNAADGNSSDAASNKLKAPTKASKALGAANQVGSGLGEMAEGAGDVGRGIGKAARGLTSADPEGIGEAAEGVSDSAKGVGKAGLGAVSTARGIKDLSNLAKMGTGSGAGAETAAGAAGVAGTGTTAAGAAGAAGTAGAAGAAATGTAAGAAGTAAAGAAGTAAAGATGVGVVVVESNPIGWILTIAAIVIGLIILLIAVVVLLGLGSEARNTAGRPDTETPSLVAEESIVKRLKALNGDLKAKSELIAETADSILEELTTIETEVNAGESPKKTEMLAQITKLREAITRLKTAVEKSAKNSTPLNNKQTLPAYVISARDTAINELDKLVVLIKEGTGSRGDKIVELARSEMAKAPKETGGDNRPIYGSGGQAGQVVPYNIDDQWCAAFVGWVFRNAGYSGYNGGYSVPNVWEYMKTNHYAFLAGEDTPKAGDMFMTGGAQYNDGKDHIGIVIEVLNGGKQVRTIEGNLGHTVGTRVLDVGQTPGQAWRFARMRN